MSRRSSDRRVPLPLLILAAAVYASAEIGAALAAGFFVWGRAEALLFLALRPWLLLLAAALAARHAARDRALFYVLALLLAAFAETLLLLGLGAWDPWPQMLRGLAAGAALLAVFELVLQLGRKFFGQWARPVLTVALAVLLLMPFGLRGYEALLFGGGARAATQRPELMLMTALPIIWGEKGAFDPSSRPAAAYTALEREFTVRPLDVLDSQTLGRRNLLLLAQPRALAPEELVALDDWVRRGGRALILTDPALVWPTELPLGDARRPPPIGLLAPILSHWGLRVDSPENRALVVLERRDGTARRRLVTAAPGRLAAADAGCAVEPAGYLARCAIGEGAAIVLADADLLQDALWAAPGEAGDRRHRRIADNPLIIADLLDELSGVRRERVDGDVQWAAQGVSRAGVLALAALPLLLTLAVAALLRLRRRT